LGSAPRQRPIKAENVEENRPRPAGLSLGRTPLKQWFFASEGDMVVVLAELFTTLFEEIVDEK
jgi:hypothetical protein